MTIKEKKMKTSQIHRADNEHVIRKVAAIAGSAVFLVIAPGFVAGLAPWWISHWRIQPAFLGIQPLRFVGGILIALGTAGLLDSFLRFAVQGLGTPAPVFPTRHLVVTGLYRYVRNPIYVAVLSTRCSARRSHGGSRVLPPGTAISTGRRPLTNSPRGRTAAKPSKGFLWS